MTLIQEKRMMYIHQAPVVPLLLIFLSSTETSTFACWVSFSLKSAMESGYLSIRLNPTRMRWSLTTCIWIWMELSTRAHILKTSESSGWKLMKSGWKLCFFWGACWYVWFCLFVLRPAPKNEDEMMVAIFEYIDRLFNIIRPRRVLYMAIDGVVSVQAQHLVLQSSDSWVICVESNCVEKMGGGHPRPN